MLAASPETRARAFGIMNGKLAGESSALQRPERVQDVAQTLGAHRKKEFGRQETSRVSERGLETLLLIDWKLDQMHFLPSAS